MIVLVFWHFKPFGIFIYRGVWIGACGKTMMKSSCCVFHCSMVERMKKNQIIGQVTTGV